MGNYGIAYYGNAADFYGNATASGLSGSVQWIFLVDWDGDGTFAYNEAPYLIDLETSRGERYFVRPGGDGFESIRPGEGTATLTDKDRRFDPDYTSGPLYNKILPGRKFKMQVKDLATLTTYSVMVGFINDIPPISEIDKIQLKLRESWSLLDQEVSIPILYRNSISTAMSNLLTAAEWPALFGTSLDTETQQITAFTVDKINALDTFIELGEACLGQVFADRTGMLKFYSRGHSTMPTVAIDQAVVDKQIRRSQPWENLRNIIHVTANKKVKGRECPIWQNSGPIQVNGLADTTIYVEYGEAIDVRVYSMVANRNVNGSGTNLTSYITYELDIYSSSLEITFTNSGSQTAYITEMVVVGRPIEDQPIRKTVQNALSTSTYGKMVFDLDNPWLQDLNHAGDFATMISNFLDEPQRTIEVQIEQRPSLQYSFDLMDKITFTSAKLQINTTYFVGLIEHQWMIDTGQGVKTTLVMRPRLTDATTISNDPEDPDLPYIPEAPYHPGGGTPMPINTPTIDPEGGTCLIDSAGAPNGPYSVLGVGFPIMLYSNGTRYYDMALQGGWTRPAGFTNESYIAITGDWQVYNPDTYLWEGETSSTNWHVTINAAYEATKTPITDAGTGTRNLYISAGGANEIRNVRFEVDQTTGGIGGPQYFMVLKGRYTITYTGTDWAEFTLDMGGLNLSEYVGIYISIISNTGAGNIPPFFMKRMNCDFWNNTSDAFVAGEHSLATDGTSAAFGFAPSTWEEDGAQHFPPTGYNLRFQYGWSGSPTGYQITFDLFTLHYGISPPAHRWNIRGISFFNVCAPA